MMCYIDVFSNGIKTIGLKINPAKCYTMHLGANPRGCRPTTFRVDGTAVPFMTDGELKKFFRKPIGFRLVPDGDSFRAMMDVGEKLMTSALTPWQRLDAIRTFLFPSLQFDNHVGKHSKTEWHNLDRQLLPLIKKSLYLNINTCNGYIYGDPKKGLFGIPQLAEDSDISHIDGAFKLLG